MEVGRKSRTRGYPGLSFIHKAKHWLDRLQSAGVPENNTPLLRSVPSVAAMKLQEAVLDSDWGARDGLKQCTFIHVCGCR
jgi:hypothetical protein